ncbi:class I SAM-dependent methyltransferase [Dactylosporangium sp. NBC_01737]|uniref:O-methyltransferase n=1 Tax=Dactylosporangium sp. NBC_01737 TaxID=2975959 RepID=UPI002E0E8DD2|nr:class I SAM-dependent methyltransferase [Dactylosporangium sp. NBC_01737]
MTVRGTAAYDRAGALPEPVAAAVRAARRAGFDNSCGPEHGELLRTLARGVGPGTIGETGTGCGVGLAWLASGAHPRARIVSVEHDPTVAAVAAAVFAADPRVGILTADWRTLVRHGPFDLLVLDGGGHGKQGAEPIDVEVWLRPGAVLVIDDFTPSRGWPPLFGGQPDHARLHWLRHPAMLTTEVPLTPSSASLVGRHTGVRND